MTADDSGTSRTTGPAEPGRQGALHSGHGRSTLRPCSAEPGRATSSRRAALVLMLTACVPPPAPHVPAVTITRPTAGATVTSPMRVQGTAEVFEAVFFLEVTDAVGTVLTTQRIMAPCFTGCPGSFDVTVSFQSGAGPAHAERVHALGQGRQPRRRIVGHPRRGLTATVGGLIEPRETPLRSLGRRADHRPARRDLGVDHRRLPPALGRGVGTAHGLPGLDGEGPPLARDRHGAHAPGSARRRGRSRAAPPRQEPDRRVQRAGGRGPS